MPLAVEVIKSLLLLSEEVLDILFFLFNTTLIISLSGKKTLKPIPSVDQVAKTRNGLLCNMANNVYSLEKQQHRLD